MSYKIYRRDRRDRSPSTPLRVKKAFMPSEDEASASSAFSAVKHLLT